jgi:hypothetical protein
MGHDIREKRANESYYLGFDFTADLGTGENIASATATCSNGLNSSGSPVLSANNTQASLYISGGTAGNYYSITFKLTTNSNNVLERMFIVRVVSDTLPSAANAGLALIRLDEAKAYIGKVTDEDTAIMDQLIESVGAQFNGYTGRTLITANYANEAYDGNGKQIFYLKNYPVTGNMTVIEDDITLTAGNDNDYLCYNNEGKLFRVNSVWYYGPKEIQVTYTAGYNATSGNITLPTDIRLACLQQVAAEFQRYKTKSFREVSRSYADGSVSYENGTGLIDPVKDILNGHRRFTL